MASSDVDRMTRVLTVQVQIEKSKVDSAQTYDAIHLSDSVRPL